MIARVRPSNPESPPVLDEALEAALFELSGLVKGWERHAMRRIAQRWGQPVEVLEQAYPDVDSIIVAVYSRVIDRAKCTLEAAPATTSLADRLMITLRTELEVFAAHRAFVRVVLERMFTPTVGLAVGGSRIVDRYLELISCEVSAGKATGAVLPFHSSRGAALGFWALRNQVMTFWLLDSSLDVARTEELARGLVDKFVMALNPLQAGAPRSVARTCRTPPAQPRAADPHASPSADGGAAIALEGTADASLACRLCVPNVGASAVAITLRATELRARGCASVPLLIQAEDAVIEPGATGVVPVTVVVPKELDASVPYVCDLTIDELPGFRTRLAIIRRAAEPAYVRL